MRKSVFAICKQQSRRSACASMRLCCSLTRKYNISSFYIRNFKTLASFCHCAGQFESALVANAEDRFSRDEAHLFCWTVIWAFNFFFNIFLNIVHWCKIRGYRWLTQNSMIKIEWLCALCIRIASSPVASIIWAPSSEFVSSSIPPRQVLSAHAQPSRGARDLAFCLKVPLDSMLVWASSGGSGETARMRRLVWTFAARIGDKYQIRLKRSIYGSYYKRSQVQSSISPAALRPFAPVICNHCPSPCMGNRGTMTFHLSKPC